MMVELSARRQFYIAVGILVLLLLAAFFWLVVPLWTSSSLHAERIDMLKRQAMTMTALVDAAPKFEAEARKLSANTQVQMLTFPAQEPALAVAQLQGQLSQIFVKASASVTSSQVLAEAREGVLAKIAVQTTLESDIKGLVKALHNIASARPLLKVEKLIMRDPDGSWDINARLSQPNRLQVEIVVSAYMRVR